jgi:hypothetical protein
MSRYAERHTPLQQPWSRTCASSSQRACSDRYRVPSGMLRSRSYSARSSVPIFVRSSLTVLAYVSVVVLYRSSSICFSSQEPIS